MDASVIAGPSGDTVAIATIQHGRLDECIICLAPVSDRAVAVPCNHCSFDFVCLATWLDQQPRCPLCKAVIVAVEYDWRSPTEYQVYTIPSRTITDRVDALTTRLPRHRRPNHSSLNTRHATEVDIALIRRSNVYRHQRYSLHIGSNRFSRFRPVPPARFATEERLQSRARAWMRRELRALEVVHNEQSGRDTQGEAGHGLRRTARGSPSRRLAVGTRGNAEHLLEHVVDLLKVADIKSAEVQELVGEYFGENNTSLLLHELSSWLRSPFETLEEWDRCVQYLRRGSGGDKA